jgi:hypothetical protein
MPDARAEKLLASGAFQSSRGGMTKIPVGKTIAHAYRFVVTHGLVVLRAVALPLIAQLAVIYLLTRRSALFLAAVQAHDPSAATLLGPELLLILLAAIFFFAQFTAATETALGQPPHNWISFPFGKPMWRLLAGTVTALVIVSVIAALAFLVLMAVPVIYNLATRNSAVTMPALILSGLVVTVFFCVLVFLSIRFLFLLAPVNVAEQQLGVKRAWQLSAGNFWRAFLVMLAIALPAALINYGYSFAMAGPLHVPPGASKEVAQAAETAWRVAEMNAMADHWYLTLPLTALLMLFQLGAGCAAQVFAWRVLTADKGSDPVAPD